MTCCTGVLHYTILRLLLRLLRWTTYQLCGVGTRCKLSEHSELSAFVAPAALDCPPRQNKDWTHPPPPRQGSNISRKYQDTCKQKNLRYLKFGQEIMFSYKIIIEDLIRNHLSEYVLKCIAQMCFSATDRNNKDVLDSNL